jgi:hypothetical protein
MDGSLKNNFYLIYPVLSRTLFIFNYLKIGYIPLLKKILVDHNKCCLIINKINENIKYLGFTYYYLSVPLIDLLIIATILDTNRIIRILAIFSTVIIVLLLICLNISMASIPKSAMKPYVQLNSLIARKRINLQMKLKIVDLIERLSGPVIGIYCFELFPFTNYEFYLFAANCVKNFILFMGFM